MTLDLRNIFIFPHECVFGYLNAIEDIDLLVVDEFYKASRVHDKERSASPYQGDYQAVKESQAAVLSGAKY